MKAYRLMTFDGEDDVGESVWIKSYYSNKGEAIRVARQMCRDKVSPHFEEIEIVEVRFPTGRGAMIKLANGQIQHVRVIATIKPKYGVRYCFEEDRRIVFNIKTGRFVKYLERYPGDEEEQE
mgnify:CR=1 FL=1|tara:strand:+ start:619 stop:984 length:366 start_codon:yes stop_codon:yes gene_type:complete